ncbi:MAG: ribose-5-phosphate isomerase RpiA [Anaerolineales bacterium]|nr:ribose-5-phosphate isomerase RpiA [Anaerolineales bacterium]
MEHGALDRYKFHASEYAVQFVESGMVVGLGFGSTAIHALHLIGRKIEGGELHRIQAVPTAESIEREARQSGIPVVTLEEVERIDLTIDGADEIDPELNLIKGGGGALLREKIVAQATRREIIVADHTKLSPRLGTKFDLPVEVLPFGWGSQVEYLAGLGASSSRRMVEGDQPFISDSGNYILDCHFGPIGDLKGLARALERRAGIVEHGLFLSLASEAIIAGPEGVEHLKPGSSE